MKQFKSELLLLLPVYGIAVFFGLYIIGAIYYPGGSYVHKDSTSFDIINNYWCDLLAETTHRGVFNPGRQYALSAMFIISPVMMIFFYYIPIAMKTKRSKRLWIQTTGFISMLIAMFIFTSFHDLVIPTSGLFGLVALTLLFTELFRKNKRLFWTGIFCLILLASNNFIYYTRIAIIILPFLQKMTFVIFLTWVAVISLYGHKLMRSK